MVRAGGSGFSRGPDAAELPVPAECGGDDLLAGRRLGAELRGYFVSSFLACKRNEIERFVTDWEFREL
jgi:hypothetical protein